MKKTDRMVREKVDFFLLAYAESSFLVVTEPQFGFDEWVYVRVPRSEASI